MKINKEKTINIVYDAVSISKGIEVISGTMLQNFYVDSQSYIPDRFVTPTIIKPKVYITDPNNIISSGDKTEELSNCTWYLNNIKIDKNNTEFKLNEDNSLTIYKNSETDFKLSYKAEWLDKRKKQIITIEEDIISVSILLAENEGEPKISVDRPQNWIHNPLKGEDKETITALVGMSTGLVESKVLWSKIVAGVPQEITSKDLFYVSGQRTKSLVVDTSYIPDNMIIRAGNLPKKEQIGPTVVKGNYHTDIKFIRQYPSSLYVEIIAPNRIKDSVENKIKAKVLIGYKGGIIENPSKYFNIKWYKKSNVPGATDTYIGHGESITIISEDKDSIRVEVEGKSNYKALTRENNSIVASEKEDILTVR